jgi:hypothetical protein
LVSSGLISFAQPVCAIDSGVSPAASPAASCKGQSAIKTRAVHRVSRKHIASLKYNGFYVNKSMQDVRPNTPADMGYGIQRFYSSGAVVGATTVNSDGDTDAALYLACQDWLKLPLREDLNPNDLLGHFKVRGSSITFNIGAVDYKGTIHRNYLILDCHSHINGYRDHGVRYNFFAFEKAK